MKIFKTNLSCKFFFPQAEIKVCYLVEMQKSCCSYSVCEDFIVPVLNLSSSMYLCVCVYKICTFSVGNWANPLILHMCPHFIWIYMLTYMKIQYIYYRVFENKNCFFFFTKLRSSSCPLWLPVVNTRHLNSWLATPYPQAQNAATIFTLKPCSLFGWHFKWQNEGMGLSLKTMVGQLWRTCQEKIHFFWKTLYQNCK